MTREAVFLTHSPLQTQQSCLKGLKQIFAVEDASIAIPYIHSLAPRVFHLLMQTSDSIASRDVTEADVQLINESLEVVQLLLDKANRSKCADTASPLCGLLMRWTFLSFCRQKSTYSPFMSLSSSAF